MAHFRRRSFEILEPARPGDGASRAFDVAMVTLIAVSVATAVLRTVEGLGQRWGALFHVLEVVAVAVFTIEYLGRLWTAPEHHRQRFHPAFLGRVRYAATAYMVVDLIAILPFYVLLLLHVDARLASLFPMVRVLRILKLVRYSRSLEMLASVVWAERRVLAASATVLLVLLLFSSSLVYVVERPAQPEAFSSIPAAMWWGIVTLTTVGYGDVTPTTPLGKLLGALVTILGVGMFALPAGILASGFAQEIKQREFIVSWQLVAAVPLFARLDAQQIASITRVLEPMVVQAGQRLVEAGEPADEMFFVLSGEVEVMADPVVRLGPGSFFGEIALLTRGVRSATVQAATRCQLLVLEADDFQDLLEDHPDLEREISRVAAERRGGPYPPEDTA